MSRAGRTEDWEIHCTPGGEFGRAAPEPRLRKFRAELMKARSAKGFRGQPSRGTESGRGEFWEFGTNSSVRVQFEKGLGRDGRYHASIIIGGGQQTCFTSRNKRRRNKLMLASPVDASGPLRR